MQPVAMKGVPVHTQRMSLPHALLTSLLERPASGYDLARRFDSSIGFFWPASHQQIYRELARMDSAGWVRADEAADNARRKVYTCLPAGRRELIRWVAEGGGAPVVRDSLLVRLRADAALGPLGVAQQVRDRLADHESRLAAYRLIAERDFADDGNRQSRLQRVILEAGISYEEHSVQWCRETLAALED